VPQKFNFNTLGVGDSIAGVSVIILTLTDGPSAIGELHVTTSLKLFVNSTQYS